MANNIGEKQWYIVTTYSMHEQKTADNLRKRIENMNMQDYILRVLVAEQQVPVLDKNGLPATEKDKKTGEIKPKMKLKNLYPGYIFVEMIMTDESWYIVRNTPGVTGIAGSSGGGQKPTPVTREEIEPVLKRMGEVDESMYDRYAVGDSVRVIHGPFEGTEGKIVSIDKDTGACRIETLFFGRSTPVDVDFSEIEKV
ncbi:MAG: transcription termination/antitermination protein NusG [Candidatus Enteromonas sp.]|nr:transcription termination/antitermination protein NusG [bacterium]MDD6917700.1 transcription termination/antitermination protein NusG [bacterium]MDY6100879.1 transcription termination/antitermination protein NusG [Candidatus Enteromonas sp.]